MDLTAGRALTATSAVCVTGLVVVDTGTYWSTFGKVVILVLIQLGGFGFMTSSTILLLLLRRQVSLRDHILLREAFGGPGSARSCAWRATWSSSRWPPRRSARSSWRSPSWATSIRRPPSGGVSFTRSRRSTTRASTWSGNSESLVPFNQRPEIILTIAGLIVVGGISYSVVEDLCAGADLPA